MPMRARSLGRSVFGSPTETPSTMISPFWKGSRAFTHLMKVDLPLPEGPHTTTTSPLATSVEQSASTWKPLYHLLMFLMEIMKGSFPVAQRMMAMRLCSCFTKDERPKETTK
jgi:hypothetical protein